MGDHEDKTVHNLKTFPGSSRASGKTPGAVVCNLDPAALALARAFRPRSWGRPAGSAPAPQRPPFTPGGALFADIPTSGRKGALSHVLRSAEKNFSHKFKQMYVSTHFLQRICLTHISVKTLAPRSRSLRLRSLSCEVPDWKASLPRPCVTKSGPIPV